MNHREVIAELGGKWSEGPPPRPQVNSHHRHSKWSRVVEALQRRPGNWLWFPDRARSLPSYLRGRYPHPELEMEVRTSDGSPTGSGRRVDMWLRWVKEETGG